MVVLLPHLSKGSYLLWYIRIEFLAWQFPHSFSLEYMYWGLIVAVNSHDSRTDVFQPHLEDWTIEKVRYRTHLIMQSCTFFRVPHRSSCDVFLCLVPFQKVTFIFDSHSRWNWFQILNALYNRQDASRLCVVLLKSSKMLFLSWQQSNLNGR